MAKRKAKTYVDEYLECNRHCRQYIAACHEMNGELSGDCVRAAKLIERLCNALSTDLAVVRDAKKWLKNTGWGSDGKT